MGFSQRVNLSCHPLSALNLPSGLVDDTQFLLMQTTIASSIATAFIISRKRIVSFRSSEFNQKSHRNGNLIIEYKSFKCAKSTDMILATLPVNPGSHLSM